MVTDMYVEPETCVRHKSTGDDQKGLDHVDGDELEYAIIVYPHETIGKGAVREAIPNSEAKILILVDAECRNCAQTGDKKILFTIPEERIVKMKDITSATALCKRGTAFWMLGLIERAYRDFSAIYEDRVDCPMAYEFLGEYYAGLGDFTNAIINFTKAIELNPSNYKAYFYRAAALDKHKNHKKAIEDYSKALELNPYFIKAYGDREEGYGFTLSE